MRSAAPAEGRPVQPQQRDPVVTGLRRAEQLLAPRCCAAPPPAARRTSRTRCRIHRLDQVRSTPSPAPSARNVTVGSRGPLRSFAPCRPDHRNDVTISTPSQITDSGIAGHRAGRQIHHSSSSSECTMADTGCGHRADVDSGAGDRAGGWYAAEDPGGHRRQALPDQFPGRGRRDRWRHRRRHRAGRAGIRWRPARRRQCGTD